MSTTFTKEVLKKGDASKTISKGNKVTVRADLYLKTGKAIWSTHESSGFLFSGTSVVRSNTQSHTHTQNTAKHGPQPFSYESGTGAVIRGWDDGVGTMTLGEKAKLTIPWQYGYGVGGHPGFSIPPKADLVFEIEVLKID
jgi:FKBP-type peptidyl-prolyl cis-trans isomerase 2